MEGEKEQKDFLQSLFSQDFNVDQFQQSMSPHRSQQQQPFPHDIESITNLMSFQPATPTSPLTPASYNQQAILQQQIKLAQFQQLQQLQNQIFQQQIALLGDNPHLLPQSSQSDPPQDRHQELHGLPTPGSSAELRAQQSMEYVSPMILNYMDVPQSTFNASAATENTILPPIFPAQQYNNAPRGSASAPADIAFSTASQTPDIDIELSPLTSPWLGAEQTGRPSISQNHGIPSSRPTSNKRGPSPSNEDISSTQSRKRQSPAIRPTNSSGILPISNSPSLTGGMKRSSRTTSKSANSTPLIRSSRSRKGSVGGSGDVVADSPSPVDLSMPPPSAPPMGDANAHLSAPTSTASETNITPVTPAIIMQIGRMTTQQHSANGSFTSSGDKSKSSSQSDAVSLTKGRSKRGTSMTAPSPNLKAILPAGQPSNLTPTRLDASSTTFIPEVRKTSHKAAEQKRRDSLKSTFDDLRGLLPPIPLAADGENPDATSCLLPTRPLLPGALPPRGPPKVGKDGPNKGVSKLQLLICGNEFIRILRARVERRDEEIARLREEVGQLRGVTELVRDLPGEKGDMVRAIIHGMEKVDLEKDIDAPEMAAAAKRMTVADVQDEDEDDVDDN